MKKSAYIMVSKILLFWVLIGVGAVNAFAQDNQRVWNERTPMPTARTGVVAVELNGDIYVMGGEDQAGDVLDVVEIYNPASNTWSIGPKLRTPRFNAAAVVYEGNIFMMGGEDDTRSATKKVEVFIPSENDWESFDNLTKERVGLAAVVLNDELYVLGGSDANANILDTVEYLDTDEEKWELSPAWTLDVPRALFTIVAIDDAAYAIGGFSTFGPMGLVQEYDENNGTNNLEPLMPGRGGLAAVELDDVIYAIGGRRANDEVVSSVDRFFPNENRWEQAPFLRTARDRFATVSYDGRIFVFGGTSNSGAVLSSVEAYEVVVLPETNGDMLTTEEDNAMSINVLLNDTNPSDGDLIVSSFSQPSNGIVTQLNESTVTYNPNQDFFGTDAFQYTARNDEGGTAQATVQVIVTPVNDSPRFISTPILGAVVDSVYTYRVVGGDPDNEALTIESVELPEWLTFNETQNGDGLLGGTPTGNDVGNHSVVLNLSDGIETVEQRFVVAVVASLPQDVLLLQPSNGMLDLETSLTFEWSALGATSFEFEVALDSLFSMFVVQEMGLSNATYSLDALMPNTTYYWRIRASNVAGTTPWSTPFTFRTARDTGVEKELPGSKVSFLPNYPNPFRTVTTFEFDIFTMLDSRLDLTLFDMQGREIENITVSIGAPGRHRIEWNGEELNNQQPGSGIYVVRLTYGDEYHTRLITLVK